MTTNSTVGTTREVEVDWTIHSNYSRLVEEEIQEYSHIEVTEDLREGGIHAQKAWAFWFQYLSGSVWKTSLDAEILQFCSEISEPHILSLGCGYGGHEIRIAKSLKPPYRIVGVDLNPGILKRAKAAADAERLNIEFLPLDINYLKLGEGSFDLIMAHASLHHILNLEHVFHQIYCGLKN